MNFDNKLNFLLEKSTKGAPETLPEFLETRKAGAEKIAKAAKEKGGPSLLTAAHFKAKRVPYTQAIKHAKAREDSKPLEGCKERADELVKMLKNWHKMSQTEFQKITGELEAYGESYIKSKEV
jgi:hypothetical protein